ncbi:MAG: MBL fold metallo-hydrolase [Bacteroidetes bacterium]|nr:MBL fold metallo-hydrolase [Bacteroidota bacterium]
MNGNFLSKLTFLVIVGISNIFGNIEMKNVKVTDDIEIYMTFKEGRKYACNYTVILNGNDALIIDSGYKEEASLVMEDLKRRGIRPLKQIFSHPHEDHVRGYDAFGDVEILAGEFFYEELDTSYAGIEKLEVNQVLKDGDHFSFGEHELSFMYTPGHAKCSITTIIDKKYFHVGDLVFRTEDRLLSIPYLGENNSNYVRSLEIIKEGKPDKLMLGHGDPIEGNEKINTAIDKLIYYIQNLEAGTKEITLQECLKDDASNYGFHSLHEVNLKKHKTK